ncbi:L-ectoine synthase [Halomonas daqingensis]|uniref:ectoine synthase n=1 Tax=Billgrantia desiderata TaxID=52021 RepID=UPI001F3645D4|nr:ectoine synthase [Halomonas desiderata]MCE8027710.1 L-ectoine synthase [Halomonas desiderata]
MKIISRQDAKDKKRYVKTGKFSSLRMLVKEDNPMFSVHETKVFSGQEIEICYFSHEEYVYVLQGSGEIFDYINNSWHHLIPGVLYHVEKGLKHKLVAKTDMLGVCIFVPACKGDEVHDEFGSY